MSKFTLSTLVSRLNKRAGLNLQTPAERTIVDQLRTAGYPESFDAVVAREVALAVFEHANRAQSKTAAALKEASILGGGPKLISSNSERLCPRCKGNMRGVQLHTRQMADYCQRCKIALVP